MENADIRFKNKRDIELIKFVKENFPLFFHCKTNTELTRVVYFFMFEFLTEDSVGGITMHDHLLEVLDKYNKDKDGMRKIFHADFDKFMEFGINFREKDAKKVKWD